MKTRRQGRRARCTRSLSSYVSHVLVEQKGGLTSEGLTVNTPIDAAHEEGHKVHLAEKLDIGERLPQAPEDENSSKANGESEQQPLVRRSRAEGLAGSDGAPEDGGREEAVDGRALELHGRQWRTDILNVHLEDHGGGADEGTEKSGCNLR